MEPVIAASVDKVTWLQSLIQFNEQNASILIIFSILKFLNSSIILLSFFSIYSIPIDS